MRDESHPPPRPFVPGQSFVVPVPDLPRGAVPLHLIWVPAGTFLMGSSTWERQRQDDEDQHPVTLSRGFWLGKHLVTQAQYAAVLGQGHRWPSLFSHLPDSNDRPVEKVSWEDAVHFCERLNTAHTAHLPEGYRFALPTEAQWEYACRAGTHTRYHSGNSEDDLSRVDWHAENSGGTSHPVGQKPPNPWGFHDVHGNVMEWCFDWFDDYSSGAVTDWTGPPNGIVKAVRGRSWLSTHLGGEFRSAARLDVAPRTNHPWLGFRVSLRAA